MEKKVQLTDSFNITKRRSLIVWVYSLRQLKALKRFGTITYVSKRMKYVIIYMNEADIEINEKKIKKLHFVRSIEPSYRPDVEVNISERIGTRAAFHPEEETFEVEDLKTEIKLAEKV